MNDNLNFPANLSSFSSNNHHLTSLNNVDSSSKHIDDAYHYYVSEYDKYSKELDSFNVNRPWYIKDLGNWNPRGIASWIINGIGGMFGLTDWWGKKADYDNRFEHLKNKRDEYFRLMQDAYANRINLLQNLKNNSNRYLQEFDALKKIGITNPYYLLKNGPLNNSVNLSSSLKSNPLTNSNSDSNSYHKKNDKKFNFKLLFLLKFLGII